MGDDYISLFDVAEVRGRIAAFGGRSGFRHVLHHDVGGGETADEQSALVADHRAEPVIFVKSVGRSAGTSFLPEPEVNAADDLALFVEIFQRRFHTAVEQHPAIDFDDLLAAEIFRVANAAGRAQRDLRSLLLLRSELRRELCRHRESDELRKSASRGGNRGWCKCGGRRLRAALGGEAASCGHFASWLRLFWHIIRPTC